MINNALNISHIPCITGLVYLANSYAFSLSNEIRNGSVKERIGKIFTTTLDFLAGVFLFIVFRPYKSALRASMLIGASLTILSRMKPNLREGLTLSNFFSPLLNDFIVASTLSGVTAKLFPKIVARF